MKQSDIAQVIDALKLYTEPITAEVRAYRAEVSAFRAESRADFERLDSKLTDLDAEVGRIARRVFRDDEGT
jgi:hypothetical protein